MFRTRLISGVVLVILALFFLINGGWLLWAVSLILSLIGLMELYRVFQIHRTGLGWTGYALTVIYYVLLAAATEFQLSINWLLYVMIVMMVFLLIMVHQYPKFHSSQIMQAIFGVLYVGVMFSFLYQTRALPNGTYTVWLIFISSWGCDTCAYCIGKLIGKHKMSPILSPKKSVEGAIGGVAGTMLLTYFYARIFAPQMGITHMQVCVLALISAAGALISMVGDLTASAIKRNYEVKDYGKLIPGHGGVLDRFDSVIFTAPVIYFLAYYFM
ncbi:MAG: phosphatidate cytidylyltransferase [Lachnospiraceae bacterium]|nr:phosphatidate cytidylyltransferase [bacterium]MDY5516459.1 phosphatidate cytidylyltransferase [Lachnospiraceae bacterium]